MEEGSLAFAGRISVFDSFASCANASTYLSATVSETAWCPPGVLVMASAIRRIPSALACARRRIASASPVALLICSDLSASDWRIVDCLWPSATLIAAWREPISKTMNEMLLYHCRTPIVEQTVYHFLHVIVRTLRIQDLCSLGTLGRNLLMHALDDFGWRVNVANLVTEALDTPVCCCRVDSFDNVGVQMSAFCQRAIQCHLTNLCTHGRLSKLGNRVLGILNPIRCLVRIYDSKVKHTIQVQRYVVCKERGLLTSGHYLHHATYRYPWLPCVIAL